MPGGWSGHSPDAETKWGSALSEQRESAQPERTKTRPGRAGQREGQRIRETDTWLAPAFLT